MKVLLSVCVFLMMLSCEEKQIVPINPPAEGFNLEASDAKAIEIADAVMIASGGREVWDSTEYVQWRFFGNRLHTWNKKTGDLIIDSEKDSLLIKMNLKTMEGVVVIDGQEVKDETARQSFLKRGSEFWINDSYWIFLPYKLKDSGVTLKYLDKGETTSGKEAERLELTFDGVGVTPENKYIVYVDPSTNLICQWDFFTNYEDEEPRFSTPWEDYKEYEGLLLSASRGDGRGMQEIEVGSSLAKKFE